MVVRMPSRSSEPSIELQIDELVLHGFSRRDGVRIANAVEREIAKLLSAREVGALPSRSVALDRVDAGAIRLSGNERPGAVGSRIAERVVGQLPIPPGGGKSHV